MRQTIILFVYLEGMVTYNSTYYIQKRRLILICPNELFRSDGMYWVNQKYFTEEAYNVNVKFANCHGKSKLLLVRPVLL